MRSNKLGASLLALTLLFILHTTSTVDLDDHRPALTAQFFYGKHVQAPPSHWYPHPGDDSDEDDYKPLDTSTSEDEGQTNSTIRHSSEQQTGYDSDEDDRDNRRRNNFLIHRGARKRTKNEQRFVWHPFTPSFLINYEPNAPINPFVMSKWSRKPNDILLVVLQQQQPSASSAASCTCGGSQNETTPNMDDLRKERNESTSSAASVDNEPHLTAVDPPSSCIWAIVACCAPNNYHFRFGCFAYLGCSIAFWDAEPCQLSIMLEAARQAHSYYNQFDFVPAERPHPDAENFPNNEAGANATTPVPSTKGSTTTISTTTPPSTTTASTTTPSVATTTEQITTTT